MHIYSSTLICVKQQHAKMDVAAQHLGDGGGGITSHCEIGVIIVWWGCTHIFLRLARNLAQLTTSHAHFEFTPASEVASYTAVF